MHPVHVCMVVWFLITLIILLFFQNLKVKSPKDSKDCTSTVSMEGKCVRLCLYVLVRVCVGCLGALRLHSCHLYLCMQWQSLGGKRVDV